MYRKILQVRTLSKFCNNVIYSSKILNFKTCYSTLNTFISHPRRPRLNSVQIAKFTTNKEQSEQLFTNDEQLLNEIDSGKELHHISTLFPEPKGTLHNFYQRVKTELKNSTIHLPTIQYKIIGSQKKGKNVWNAIYKITWPYEVKFDASGTTKLDASKRAAIKALYWLKRSNKINPQGLPIIYEHYEINEYNKPLKIAVDSKTSESFKKIEQIYDTQLASIVRKQCDILNIDSLIPEKVSFHPIPSILNGTRISEKYLDLPILKYKNKITHLIEDNQVLIIKGEPGCGKSTQVPQYILESCVKNGDGQCRIAVSQPRRLAAISLAEHVGKEYENNRLVGYQVRLESTFDNKNSAILYCTSGILLKRLQNDPELRSFTHIILDEAHERDVNTDMLLVLLRKAIECNSNLKLIVMSATMDTNLFKEYFDDAPVVHIPGFTYPVKSHFLEDIPLKLPKTREMLKADHPNIVPEEICEVIKWIATSKPEGAILCFLPGWEEIKKVKNLLEESWDVSETMSVLPLHSRLSNDVQRKIFEPVQNGIRKIILTTNIAETSVTINDVVYVIDSGAHKEQRLEKERSRECIDNYWVSQSNVDQRRGRAGRVRPGESFHLFPKSKYDSMNKYAIPEILRVSLTKLVLDSKIYNPYVNAVDFLQEMPNPPNTNAIEVAVNELIALKILTADEKLTPLGKIIAHYSLSPSLSKALVYSHFFGCSLPILDIVTALSTDTEIFISALIHKASVRSLKQEFNRNSDHIALHELVKQWRKSFSEFTAKDWCNAMQINFNKMFLLSKIREVHINYLENIENIFSFKKDFSDNSELIKAVLLSGLNKILKQHIIVKKRSKKQSILSTEHKQPAMIASDSVNYKLNLTPSTFLLYSNETHSLTRKITVVRETSIISPLAILLFKNDFTLEKKNNVDEDDAVCLQDQYSPLMFTCDNGTAKKIMTTRNILDKTIQYFLIQSLKNERVESKTIASWMSILREIDSILIRNKSC